MIKDWFKNRPGSDMVSTHDYVLQDPNTRSDLQVTTDFYSSVRPGQKLLMFMLFHGNAQKHFKRASLSDTLCPKCGQAQMCLGANGIDKSWSVNTLRADGSV